MVAHRWLRLFLGGCWLFLVTVGWLLLTPWWLLRGCWLFLLASTQLLVIACALWTMTHDLWLVAIDFHTTI